MTKDKLYDELFTCYSEMLKLDDLDDRKIEIIKNRQKKVSQVLKTREEKEKKTYQRMFGGGDIKSNPKSISSKGQVNVLLQCSIFGTFFSDSKKTGSVQAHAPSVSSGNSENSSWVYVGSAIGVLVLACAAYAVLKK